MSASIKEAILLTNAQKNILTELTTEANIEAMLVRRAQIILSIADSKTNQADVARNAGVSTSTVSTWRGRWLDQQETLANAERDGIAAEQLKEMIQMLLSKKALSENEVDSAAPNSAESNNGEAEKAASASDEPVPVGGQHRNSSTVSADINVEPNADSKEILTELATLRQQVYELQQENKDLNVMLEMTTEHSDTVSEELQQENDDLAFMLEMTTEHSDTVSEDLHQKAEDALRESERRLRLIVQATPVPVIISRTADREIQYANPMTLPLLGISNDAIIGNRITDFFLHPTEWKELLARIAADKEVDQHELEMKTISGDNLWATVSMRALEFNNEASVLAAFHDITARKQGELRLQQQVENLRLELDEARLSSQAAEESGTAFFSNMDAARVKRTGARLFAVHSFRGGTGKSNIVANLAALLAASGQRVGMIDTDLQAPGLHVLFGLAGKKIEHTVNDLLWGTSTAEQVARDVTGYLGSPVPGKLFLIPASTNPGYIAQVLSQGYEATRLIQSIQQLVDTLELDILLIDTHPGVNEEALLSMEASDAVLLTLCADKQDYEGTGITVQVARKLQVPSLMLMLNRIPESYDMVALRQQIESTYGCPVVGMLPHSEEAVTFDKDGMFVLRHPDHPITEGLRQIAMALLGVGKEQAGL